MFDALNEAILSAAGSPWIYLGIVGLVFLDAFFPPVPSETLVVATAAIGIASGTPNVVAVIAAAAIGAIAGDNLTFWFGRKIGLTRFAWMRSPRLVRVFGWAARGLSERAGVLLITGRYIPVGRVAVNLAAGATGFPMRRFVPLSLIAGTSWALYSVGIGVLAGAWFTDNPMLGAVVAIVVALVLGAVIDRISVARRTAAESALVAEATPAPTVTVPE